MHVEGIGELRDLGTVWRLRYAACGHGQEIGRAGLEEPARAVDRVRRHFARCLTCQLAQAETRPPRPVSGRGVDGAKGEGSGPR
jgi:hypothetical protein